MTGPNPASSVDFDWDVPRFHSVDACMAIHCATQWLTDLISGSPVKYPLGVDEIVELAQRRRFIFKFRSVFHLALIREISTRAGALPLVAARDLSRVCVDSDHLFPADLRPDGRPRFLVFAPATGESMMLVREEGEPEIQFADLLGGKGDSGPWMVLNVTPIFDRVVEALDVHKAEGELIEDEEEFDRFLLTAERWPPRTAEGGDD